jgi:hypothetical protein
MKIDPKAPAVSTPSHSTAQRRPSGQVVTVSTPTPTRLDSVEWSSDVRAGQSSERLAQIRDRVDNHFYDSPAVAERVARRLLASGEL